jgi:hypothetical protein
MSAEQMLIHVNAHIPVHNRRVGPIGRRYRVAKRLYGNCILCSFLKGNAVGSSFIADPCRTFAGRCFYSSG